MDYVLDYADQYVLDNVYAGSGLALARDDLYRQALSLFVIVNLGGYFLYFLFAGLDYFFLFDHGLMKHPKFLKNQVALEIAVSCKAIPVMAVLTTVLFLLEVRGYSQLYDDVSLYGGWPYILFSIFGFLAFTDMGIYWIHRWLHIPWLYQPIHKLHHKWIVPTPFASHAFHPLDGFLQSVPYHVAVFAFPVHKWVYLGLFVFVNIWTVSIHDGYYNVPALLKGVLNSAQHHTLHHTRFRVNYGQYFVFWDKIGGSYKAPAEGDLLAKNVLKEN